MKDGKGSGIGARTGEDQGIRDVYTFVWLVSLTDDWII